jgi:hypothetical protein
LPGLSPAARVVFEELGEMKKWGKLQKGSDHDVPSSALSLFQ